MLYPNPNSAIDREAALAAVDKLIVSKTGKYLSTLQTAIFRGAWSGQKYEQIAQASHCSDVHVKMVGAELWELLSVVLEERVTKKTFRASLERKVRFNCKPEHPEPSPLPWSDLELPEGQVPLGSNFYIPRLPIEAICYQTILKPGSLIRIKAPRQMGKTSLMTRILHHAAQERCHAVSLNLQLVDRKHWQNSDSFLRWFCVAVGRELQVPNQLEEYWDDLFGSKMSCHDYFKNYLLTQSEQHVVLALDEVDCLFQYPEIANDVFALLRSWHEEAKNQSVWAKLRLVLVHSTEVYIPLQIHQSPFNVGLSIELPEFLPEQVLDLAQRHGLNWNLITISQLMTMVAGHPYLVRVALYHTARHNITLDRLLQLAPTEAGVYTDRLRRHLGYLEQQPELAIAFKKVVEANSPIQLESQAVFQLHSMGLINLQGNQVTPRCELYRQYFRDRF